MKRKVEIEYCTMCPYSQDRENFCGYVERYFGNMKWKTRRNGFPKWCPLEIVEEQTMMEEKQLKCEDPECGHEFDFSEAEQHECSMTLISIGCPKCSVPITYLRNEGD